MKNKMTTNSPLSINEPKRKKMKTKTKQTTRTGTEQKNGHHMEGFQWHGEGRKEEGRKGTRKKHN